METQSLNRTDVIIGDAVVVLDDKTRNPVIKGQCVGTLGELYIIELADGNQIGRRGHLVKILAHGEREA